MFNVPASDVYSIIKTKEVSTMTGIEKARAFMVFCKSKKYNPFLVHRGTIEKTFNDGHGSLCCFRFTDDNKVVVNKGFFSDSDKKNLEKFCEHIGIIPEYINKSIGYPDWYFKSL
jgi:hypothetical protein